MKCLELNLTTTGVNSEMRLQNLQHKMSNIIIITIQNEPRLIDKNE